jgi:hypothetical protein
VCLRVKLGKKWEGWGNGDREKFVSVGECYFDKFKKYKFIKIAKYLSKYVYTLSLLK